MIEETLDAQAEPLADDDKKTDMYLTVNCTVQGTFDGSSVTVSNVSYAQASANPPSTNVVQSNGTIDLRNMDKSTKNNTDIVHITFNLISNIQSSLGQPTLSFPSDPNAAVTINGQSLPTGEFSATSGNDLTSIVLTDADVDKEQNHYCLQPQLYYNGQFFDVPVDPPIIDRGKTS